MVDRVLFSPSVGSKNLNKTDVPRKSGDADVTRAGRPKEPAGGEKPPARKPLAGSGSAVEKSLSAAEKEREKQRVLNSLTLSVRRAATSSPDTQELIRESIGEFLREIQPPPDEGAAHDPDVPVIDLPGSGEAPPAPPLEGGEGEGETVQAAGQSPASGVRQSAAGSAGKRDPNGDDSSGARGELVDVVT